jgi:hypothetical protein
MRHGKVWMLGDDLVDFGQWIGLIGVQQVACTIKRVNRLLRAECNRIPLLVEPGHHLLLIWAGEYK